MLRKKPEKRSVFSPSTNRKNSKRSSRENLKIPKTQKAPYFYEALVPGAGIEPARDCSHKILSLACLPIPPSRLHSGIPELLGNRNKKALESRAFLSGRRDSNSRPRPWQGRALPAELLSLFTYPELDLSVLWMQR